MFKGVTESNSQHKYACIAICSRPTILNIEAKNSLFVAPESSQISWPVRQKSEAFTMAFCALAYSRGVCLLEDCVSFFPLKWEPKLADEMSSSCMHFERRVAGA